MSVLHTATAWDLIGFDGNWPMDHDPYGDEPEPVSASVRLAGGRALYEAVMIRDGGNAVRLARLDVDSRGLRQVNRYVRWDDELEVVTT